MYYIDEVYLSFIALFLSAKHIQQQRMTIIHKVDKFLLELFPDYKNSNKDLNILKEELIKYYTID